jgi:hypothetical protein
MAAIDIRRVTIETLRMALSCDSEFAFAAT